MNNYKYGPPTKGRELENYLPGTAKRGTNSPAYSRTMNALTIVLPCCTESSFNLLHAADITSENQNAGRAGSDILLYR